ncbi:MAG TPA: preprotein translocase subunit YajC [Terriglobales bacterium]
MDIYALVLVLLQTGGASSWIGIAPLILIFGVFYLLLILPQQRRQKKWQAMLGELKTGDKVVTSGGLRGTIVALKDDSLHLRVPPDNLRIEVTRSSIVSLTKPDEPAVTK